MRIRASSLRVAALSLAGLAGASCGDDSDHRGPPTASIDSAFTVAGRKVPPTLLNGYVAGHLGFTSRGGEMRCAYLPLGARGDRVFLNTLCLELIRSGDSLAVGSGRGGPVALRLAADGDSVRVLSHEVPVDGEGHAASIRRIFPRDAVERIFAATPAHNAAVGRLEYYLRGEAAARLGLRPPARAPDSSRTHRPLASDR